jgi:hypothetical protein
MTASHPIKCRLERSVGINESVAHQSISAPRVHVNVSRGRVLGWGVCSGKDHQLVCRDSREGLQWMREDAQPICGVSPRQQNIAHSSPGQRAGQTRTHLRCLSYSVGVFVWHNVWLRQYTRTEQNHRNGDSSIQRVISSSWG